MRQSPSSQLFFHPRIQSAASLSRLGACALVLGWSAAPALAAETAAVQVLDLPRQVLPGFRETLVVSQSARGSRAFGDALAHELSGEAPGRDARVPLLGAPVPVDIKVARANVDGPLDPAAIRRLVAEHGGRLVATGSVDGVEESYVETEEDRERVVKTDTGEKKERYKVPCAERVARVDYAWTLYGADGVVILQDSGSDTKRSKDCDEAGEDPLQIASVTELTAPTISSKADEFARSFRPAYHTIAYPVQPGRSNKGTVSALATGSWETAAGLTLASLQSSPFDHAQIHHAAALLLATGNFAESQALLEMARRYAARDEHAELEQASARCQEALARVEEAYGVRPAPIPLPALDPLVTRARALATAPAPEGEAMLVRPLLRPEVDLLGAPEKKAETVGSLPEWTRVFKISAEGDFVQILLPDGATRGWVKKNNLKSL